MNNVLPYFVQRLIGGFSNFFQLYPKCRGIYFVALYMGYEETDLKSIKQNSHVEITILRNIELIKLIKEVSNKSEKIMTFFSSWRERELLGI